VRSAFFKALHRLAAENPDIFLVVGDLGFGVTEEFSRAFPGQFLNAGVAEQNMTGIAAGLALSGKTVFTYSIANFPILRCLEQIRNDVCYHRANVKVVAVGGGYAYGSLGATHHATEDLAILRALPGMTVIAPGDPEETNAATEAIASHEGPCYLRLGRAGEPRVHEALTNFQIGRGITVRDGHDLTLMSTGGMLETVVNVAKILARKGLATRVLSMHTLKPLDEDAVLSAARETGAIFTVEEHSIIGGLGSAVAEILAEAGIQNLIFKRIALPSTFACRAGSQEYLREQNNLSSESLIDLICTTLKFRNVFAAQL
jgi:transketolase